MGRRRKGELPRYRLHKHSGQAIVSLPLGGRKYRDILLGPYDSERSRQEYDRIISEWLASGRFVAPRGSGRTDLTISELSLLFWKHAESYYRRPDGTASRELDHFRLVLDPLERLYGSTPAAEFGPLALKAVRQHMLDSGRLCRKVINQRIDHVRRLFRWAVSEQLVPSSVHEALRTVSGLRRGHPGTQERSRVKPVPDKHIEAILPFLTRQVAAMVQLQRLLGARSTEICTMRGRNIDCSGPVWWHRIDPNEVDLTGRPIEMHKTAHHENGDGTATIKVLPIGPKAQEILNPWFRANPDEFLFQPKEARKESDANRRIRRRTPLTLSQIARKPKAHPNRTPRDRYDRHSYARAISHACKKAGVPHWHPHQLKHACGTVIRQRFGAEASQVYLGHSSLSTTEICRGKLEGRREDCT